MTKTKKYKRVKRQKKYILNMETVRETRNNNKIKLRRTKEHKGENTVNVGLFRSPQVKKTLQVVYPKVSSTFQNCSPPLGENLETQSFFSPLR